MTTVVCTACGFHNEPDDQFCGGCQEYLEWSGEVLEEGTDDGFAGPPDEQPRGLVERVVDSFTGDRHDEGGRAGDTDTGRAGGPGATASGTTSAAVDEDTARREEAARLAEEAAARARETAERARRAQDEAEAEAREQTRLTEQAREAAREAERTKAEAEAQAQAENEETEQLRHRLDEAREARRRAEEELRTESAAAAAAREDSAAQVAEERARATRERAEAEERLAAEQEALDETRREVERAEAAREEAAQKARQEAEAARLAQEAAEEAERARVEAEARAAEEAEAAERARRAAALVAPTRPAAAAPSRPAPTESAGRRPSRSRRRRAADQAPADDSGPTDTAPADSTNARQPTAPVKPAASERRRRATTKEPPSKKLRPGDLVCGACGEGNNPERNFCRRCGETLAESAVVKRPWYARWVPVRRTAAPAAGTRPDRKPRKAGGAGRGARRLVRIGLTVLALAAAFAMWRNAVLREDVFDRVVGVYEHARALFDEGTPVTVEGATADSEQPDHRAMLAVDTEKNTQWTEDAPGPGLNQSITVRFDAPTTIVGVVVSPGVQDDFVDFPRPAELTFTFDDGTVKVMPIANDPEPQSQRMVVRGTASVVVEVTDVHAGQGQVADLSIRELEFRELG